MDGIVYIRRIAEDRELKYDGNLNEEGERVDEEHINVTGVAVRKVGCMHSVCVKSMSHLLARSRAAHVFRSNESDL